MLSEKEYMDYVDHIRLSVETIRRCAKEVGLEAAAVNVLGDSISLWGKDRIDENVSVCHSVLINDGIVYDHSISRYNEATGQWEE